MESRFFCPNFYIQYRCKALAYISLHSEKWVLLPLALVTLKNRQIDGVMFVCLNSVVHIQNHLSHGKTTRQILWYYLNIRSSPHILNVTCGSNLSVTVGCGLTCVTWGLEKSKYFKAATIKFHPLMSFIIKNKHSRN